MEINFLLPLTIFMSLFGDMNIVSTDAVWKALADPTRRQILELLDEEAATTGRIIERFSPRLVRTAVMKHLDVLERAKLIRVERVGRTRQNHIERQPLDSVASWLAQRVRGHQSNLKRLKHVAETNRTQRKRRK